MKKLLDMRFTIGAFFTIIGTMLLAYHLFKTGDSKVNLWTSLVFLVFGLAMVLLSARSRKQPD
jgi:nicotinamide riboside transporter PnuC